MKTYARSTEERARTARRVLGWSGRRRATPLCPCAERPGPPAPRSDTARCAPSQSAVAARALPAHSTTWRLVLASVGILLSALCFRAWGQYSIDWSTIDGGGGTSTGGVYSVAGTIGQPDAGTMSGGNYTLHGGFWGVVAAVQEPGAPLLSIFHTTTNTVAVTWPSPSTGWELQQNTNNVSSLNWSNVTSGIEDDGTTKTLIVNPPTGNRLYRLRGP